MTTSDPRIDLNCDLGEAFGIWPLGDDEALLDLARAAGLTTITEAFADRGYTERATLVPQGDPGTLLGDPDQVAARAVRPATDRPIGTVDGAEVIVTAESVCVHGDSPSAVAMVAAVRGALEAAGVQIAPFTS